MKPLNELLRPAMQAFLAQYVPQGAGRATATVRLDACESPYGAPYNRFPAPVPTALKERIAKVFNLSPDRFCLTAGVTEGVDLLIRLFCVPRRDNVVTIEPTTSLFTTMTALGEIDCRRVALGEGFSIDADRLLASTDAHTKLILLCSPNNPTGSVLSLTEVKRLCSAFPGYVVIDEAFAEFARTPQPHTLLPQCDNLVVLRSFSYAYSCAGIRLGTLHGNAALVHCAEHLKAVNPLPLPTLAVGEEMVRRRFDVDKWVKQILDERDKMMAAVAALPVCEAVYPSDASFFLARFRHAERLYAYLLGEGIAVYPCTEHPSLHNCLRITVSLTGENSALLGALRRYKE